MSGLLKFLPGVGADQSVHQRSKNCLFASHSTVNVFEYSLSIRVWNGAAAGLICMV
jgi:hypothetical protein